VAPFVAEGLRANAGRYILDSSRALATIAARTQLDDKKPKAVVESTQASRPEEKSTIQSVGKNAVGNPYQIKPVRMVTTD